MSPVGAFALERSGATLGAIVRGVDLAGPLPERVLDAILAAWWECAVLVFPDQHLSTEAQVAFSRRLGPLERTTLHGSSVVVKLSNLGPDGTPVPPSSSAGRYLKANQDWHADSSFKPVGALGSMLSARVVPTSGGETEYADMRAAYDALPDDLRRELQELEVVHDFLAAQGRVGGLDYFTDDVQRSLPPVVHPLVMTHPVTGRRSLYIGRHASHVVGRPVEEGRRLLDRLLAYACQPPRIFTHSWRAGDVVLWDNRAVLHRGRPWPVDQPRVMYRTTIAGTDGPNPWSEDAGPGTADQAQEGEP